MFIIYCDKHDRLAVGTEIVGFLSEVSVDRDAKLFEQFLIPQCYRLSTDLAANTLSGGRLEIVDLC